MFSLRRAGVGVAVAVDGVDALHVLRHHMAVGVHAEGAHLVAVLLGAVDQLGLIDHVGDALKRWWAGSSTRTPMSTWLLMRGSSPSLALPGKPLGAGAARAASDRCTVNRSPFSG